MEKKYSVQYYCPDKLSIILELTNTLGWTYCSILGRKDGEYNIEDLILHIFDKKYVILEDETHIILQLPTDNITFNKRHVMCGTSIISHLKGYSYLGDTIILNGYLKSIPLDTKELYLESDAMSIDRHFSGNNIDILKQLKSLTRLSIKSHRITNINTILDLHLEYLYLECENISELDLSCNLNTSKKMLVTLKNMINLKYLRGISENCRIKIENCGNLNLDYLFKNNSVDHLLMCIMVGNDADGYMNLGDYFKYTKNSEGLFLIGEYYGKSHNYRLMKEYYLMASENGHTCSMIFLGDYYMDIGDYIMMAKYYLMAIEKGDTNAMVKLGDYYYHTIENDYDTKIKNYLDSSADSSIGKLLVEYTDTVNKYDNMVKYYTMAIEKGNVDAMVRLGDYFQISDTGKMSNYYQMAVDAGSVQAMLKMGDYYRETDNYTNMIKYYTMAVSKNNVNAMIRLGDYYLTTEDYGMATQYYQMAVDRNDTRAMIKMGDFYQNILKDIEKMRKYYEMAMKNGYLGAMVNLTQYYSSIDEYDNIRSLLNIYKTHLQNVSVF
jgi:TPR repeat protein